MEIFGLKGKTAVVTGAARGIAVRKTSLDISVAEWERVIAVNLTGLFLCSRIAARSGCCPKWTTSPRQYCSSRGRLRDASRVSHCLSIRDIWPGKP